VTTDSGGSNAAGHVMQLSPQYELDFAELAVLTVEMDFTIIPAAPPPPADLNISRSHQWFYGRW